MVLRTLRNHLPELVRGLSGEVLALLNRDNNQAWLVGGAVRDAALGRAAHDIDIATTWHPEAVMARAEAAGLTALPTGVAHGTVTLVRNGEPIEVTTLRRDVATDGRRAVVAFSRDLAEDAARRDFTINALYADGEGRVWDPLGEGLADLAAGRVRFIGAAERRIAEDYLRILRFFRFSADHCPPGQALDATGLAACAAGKAGLAHVSVERIWSELRKLLGLPTPLAALRGMEATGVLGVLFERPDLACFARYLELEAGAQPCVMARLAALVPREEGVADRLRLSRAEAKALRQWHEVMQVGPSPAALGYRLREEAPTGLLLVHAHAATTPSDADWQALREGQGATFPLRAKDLPSHLTGADIGRALRNAEQAWITSGFRLDRDALLHHLEKAR